MNKKIILGICMIFLLSGCKKYEEVYPSYDDFIKKCSICEDDLRNYYYDCQDINNLTELYNKPTIEISCCQKSYCEDCFLFNIRDQKYFDECYRFVGKDLEEAIKYAIDKAYPLEVLNSINNTIIDKKEPLYINITLYLGDSYTIEDKLLEDFELFDKAMTYHYATFEEKYRQVTANLRDPESINKFLMTRVTGVSPSCYHEITEYIPIYEGNKMIKLVPHVTMDDSNCIDNIIEIKFYD